MSKPSSPFRRGVQTALIGIPILAIFAIDALTPLGYGEWLLYVILLTLSAGSRRIRDTVVIALVCTVLVVAGFFLSPRGVDPTVALVSRTLGILVLWLTTLLLRQSLKDEAALRESEARLRDLIDGLGPSMFVGLMTPDGTLIEANRPALKAAGLEPGDVVGRPFAETCWWAHSETTQQQLRAAISRAAAGAPSRYDVPVRTVEDVLIWLDFSLQPLRNDAGEVVFLVPSANVITERKEAETALSESRQRLALATESAHIGIWDWDVVADKLVWDAQMYGLYGVREENFSVADAAWENGVHPEDRDRAAAEIAAALGGTRDFHTSFRVVWPGGEVRHIEAHGVVQRAGDGSARRMIGVNWDITERKRAEEELRRSAEVIRLSIEYSPAAIAMFDREMKYIAFSRRFVSEYGLGEQGLMGRSHYEVFPEVPERWKEIHRRCLAGASETAEEDPFPRGNGRVDWVRWEIRPWHESDGQIGGIVLFSEVITKRKQAEEELRLLSARLLQVQDEERRRLARDLHDHTAQQLAAVAMNLSSLQRMTPELPAKAVALLEDTQALTQRASQEIRTLSYLLHSPVLEEIGLVPAVRDYASGLDKRSGVVVAVEVDPAFGRLPAETELALFRIVQESLANILKHSGSPTATVSFMRDAEEIRLEVRDQGRGFSAEGPTTPGTGAGEMGVGIPGMRERLRQLGGRFKIDSGPGGTTVRANLPVTREP